MSQSAFEMVVSMLGIWKIVIQAIMFLALWVAVFAEKKRKRDGIAAALFILANAGIGLLPCAVWVRYAVSASLVMGYGAAYYKGVTKPILGLGTVAVKTAADFDSAMSQVAAVSGSTGSDLDALRDKAREMGSKTKFSASEAAEAMNYMAMVGWKTSDMLSGIEGIMNLAAAFGEDLASTS